MGVAERLCCWHGAQRPPDPGRFHPALVARLRARAGPDVVPESHVPARQPGDFHLQYRLLGVVLELSVLPNAHLAVSAAAIRARLDTRAIDGGDLRAARWQGRQPAWASRAAGAGRAALRGGRAGPGPPRWAAVAVSHGLAAVLALARPRRCLRASGVEQRGCAALTTNEARGREWHQSGDSPIRVGAGRRVSHRSARARPKR